MKTILRQALSNHPEMARARAQIRKARAGISAAEAVWYPELTYSATPGWNKNNYGSAAIGANQLLYDFGKSAAEQGAAEAEHHKAEATAQVAGEAISLQVTQDYVALVAAKALKDEAERLVGALLTLQSRVASRVEAGASDASDLVTADVAVSRAEGERAKAEAQLVLAETNIARLIGEVPTIFASIDDVASRAEEIDQHNMGGDSPAVAAANSALEAAQHQVARAKADRLPPIRLTSTYSGSYTGEGFTDDTYVGLKIENAFSMGGLSGIKIDAAEADQAAAQSFLASEQLRVQSAAQQARLEADAARKRITRFGTLQKLTRRSASLAWEHYQLDKQPLSEAINAEREIFNATADITTARADFAKAVFKGLAARGLLTRLILESE